LRSLKAPVSSPRSNKAHAELRLLYISVYPVAYAENFRGGTKFRHNRVTSQINFRESAEGTTLLEGPGACPREDFAK